MPLEDECRTLFNYLTVAITQRIQVYFQGLNSKKKLHASVYEKRYPAKALNHQSSSNPCGWLLSRVTPNTVGKMAVRFGETGCVLEKHVTFDPKNSSCTKHDDDVWFLRDVGYASLKSF